MSEEKVQYRFVSTYSGPDYQDKIEKLLNEGFMLRGNSFVFNDLICGELIKYPEGYISPMPMGMQRAQVIPPGKLIPIPPPIDALSQVGPEGQEIMSRIIKCYNNPKFREMLEEMGKDFIDDEENTALTDSDLERLAGENP